MNKYHYHFIGVGGIGMSALASLVLDKGGKVSGSDLRSNAMTTSLAQRGAHIFTGHAPEHIDQADFVVYSSAVSENNPEFAAAKKNGVPVVRRAQLLAELMQDHIGITVAGAHGKTTTSSMIAHLLIEAGLKPTMAIGGLIQKSQTNAQLGQGKYFVTEVDESDGTFLYFKPDYSVITNIDFEHIDHYGSWDQIIECYRQFINNTNDDGCLIACGEDERLLKLLNESQRTYQTYGFSNQSTVYAENVSFDKFVSTFDCCCKGEKLGRIELNAPGNHNVANALACVSLGLQLGLDFNSIRQHMQTFSGVQRRFQLKGTIDNIVVIDDYAHHPTEIKAIMETANAFKANCDACARLVTVFQPHRYSRLEALMQEFASSLAVSDQVIITDIYAASEAPREGVTAQKLTEHIAQLTSGTATYVPEEKLVETIVQTVRDHDIVLTLGAGDITKYSEELVLALKQSVQTGEKVKLL